MFVYPLQSLQTPKSLLVGISKQWQYLLSLKYLLIYLLPFVLIRSTNAKKVYSPIPTSAIIITLPIIDSMFITLPRLLQVLHSRPVQYQYPFQSLFRYNQLQVYWF